MSLGELCSAEAEVSGEGATDEKPILPLCTPVECEAFTDVHLTLGFDGRASIVMGGTVCVKSVCRDPPIPGSGNVRALCTQSLCLPSISGGPTLTPFVLSVAVICFLSELKPSPPCCTEWSPAPSRLPAQIWDSKHTSWGLRVCTANLYGEGARGDRKNIPGAGTPWGEDPRNLSVPDSSLKSLLVSSFTLLGRGLIRPPGSPHPLTGSLLPLFSADPSSPEASPQKAETAQTGTAC